MGFILLLVIAGAIYFFWKHTQKEKGAAISAKIAALGEVKGKDIKELEAVLGKPWVRMPSDSNPNVVNWH